jgi:hypothetical protein
MIPGDAGRTKVSRLALAAKTGSDKVLCSPAFLCNGGSIRLMVSTKNPIRVEINQGAEPVEPI